MKKLNSLPGDVVLSDKVTEFAELRLQELLAQFAANGNSSHDSQYDMSEWGNWNVEWENIGNVSYINTYAKRTLSEQEIYSDQELAYVLFLEYFSEVNNGRVYDYRHRDALLLAENEIGLAVKGVPRGGNSSFMRAINQVGGNGINNEATISAASSTNISKLNGQTIKFLPR